MNCKKCGAVLVDDALFCIQCGTKVEKEHVCSNCGERLPLEAKFCFKCGTSIKNDNVLDSDIQYADFCAESITLKEFINRMERYTPFSIFYTTLMESREFWKLSGDEVCNSIFEDAYVECIIIEDENNNRGSIATYDAHISSLRAIGICLKVDLTKIGLKKDMHYLYDSSVGEMLAECPGLAEIGDFEKWLKILQGAVRPYETFVSEINKPQCVVLTLKNHKELGVDNAKYEAPSYINVVRRRGFDIREDECFSGDDLNPYKKLYNPKSICILNAANKVERHPLLQSVVAYQIVGNGIFYVKNDQRLQLHFFSERGISVYNIVDDLDDEYAGILSISVLSENASGYAIKLLLYDGLEQIEWNKKYDILGGLGEEFRDVYKVQMKEKRIRINL